MAKLLKGSLILRKTSNWWYGRYKVGGKERIVNLQQKVEGQRPANLKDTGCRTFETSRRLAQVKLDALIEQINTPRKREEVAQAVHIARYGESVTTHSLEDLSSLWLNMPRKKPPSPTWQNQCLSWIGNFVAYCEEYFPETIDLDYFGHDKAMAYMKVQEGRGISPKTYNDILAVLKLAFREAGSPAFNRIVTKDIETTSRIPYTPDELRDILEASKSDPFIRPIIITAMCTAMRKGDCCLLEWESINLDTGFIRVKTSKTGATIGIPITGLLYEELSRRPSNDSKYVFPKQAAQYQSNPKMLTERLRKVLALAGFHDGDNTPLSTCVDNYDPAELKRKAERHIASVPTKAKRERMAALLERYIEGDRLCKAAETLGIPKGSASGYLNEIQKAIGINFIRGKKTPTPSALPAKRGDVHTDRKTGLLRASVRDWHSFRTTWITIALCSGMPYELVSKITGHTTAKVILANYLQPQQEQLREAFQKHMPNLLTAGRQSLSERAAEILRAVDSKMNKDDIYKRTKEALQILEGNGSQI